MGLMRPNDKELTDALRQMKSEFRPNELAYLATTTKVELPFRDHLAFLLHLRFRDRGLLVAREWNRIDIGIVDDNNNAVCLIELKAMYTFNALNNLSEFVDATAADEIKARGRAQLNTAVYSLLLATHLDNSVDRSLIKVVKYSRDINRAVRMHQSADNIASAAKKAVDVALRGRNVIDTDNIPAGEAFGMKVGIFYWLVREGMDKPFNE